MSFEAKQDNHSYASRRHIKIVAKATTTAAPTSVEGRSTTKQNDSKARPLSTANQPNIGHNDSRERIQPPESKHGLAGYTSERDMAGQFLKSLRTLRAWRNKGEGPPWLKIGKCVYYPDDGIRLWLKLLEHDPVRSMQRQRGRRSRSGAVG
jgi:hypothetical protein